MTGASTASAQTVRGSSTEPGPADAVSLLGFANVLLLHGRLIIRLPLGAAAMAVVMMLLLPPTYTATATFVPEAGAQGRVSSGLAGLAGQLGLTIPTEATHSPRFYADVLRSRELLARTLQTRFANPHGALGDSATLAAILGVHGRSAADSLQDGVRRLAKLVTTGIDNQTQIVTVAVRSQFPKLAATVANQLVQHLNDFNTMTRQSQARRRRLFIEERLAEGQRELRAAEDDLKRFYEQNRSWDQSPKLTFEEGRLRRVVDLRQQVYVTLNREYETARIEEVNDAPVITVIDSAVAPVRKSGPRRAQVVSVAFVLGAVAAVFVAFLLEYWRGARRESPEEYRRFRDLSASLRRELRDGLSRLGRRSNR